MRILVCIKQVPDNDNELVIDRAAGKVAFAGRPAYKMNRYDEYAVETALQIRDAMDQSKVDAVSMGPEHVDEVLRRALGMGIDHGIQIKQGAVENLRPLIIASTIALLVKNADYDLILTGAISEDDMNGTTGPMIAAQLDWPCATNVVTVEPLPDKGVVHAESEIDGGSRELLEISLPAVLTIQASAQQPRYPRLSMMLRANRYPLEFLDMPAMVSTADHERVVNLAYPASSRSGTFLSGSLEDKADELIRLLKKKAILA